MKKILLLVCIIMMMGNESEAQFLKDLKKKVEERTTPAASWNAWPTNQWT
ncbi:hypothetical protein [Cognataquiflexum rubidum]|nr:hypothetical protein [Cognataquiflexum rubidum]MCH6232960.1 hypothetical protein [Cognataquiflexum rubidum]